MQAFAYINFVISYKFSIFANPLNALKLISSERVALAFRVCVNYQINLCRYL
jgi:hypothetical protein